jgi:predicted RNA polymerase sigma factor
MDTAAIIKALGGATKLALRLGCGRSAVSNWPRDGIPAKFWNAVVDVARADGVDGITLDSVSRRPERAAAVAA